MPSLPRLRLVVTLLLFSSCLVSAFDVRRPHAFSPVSPKPRFGKPALLFHLSKSSDNEKLNNLPMPVSLVGSTTSILVSGVFFATLAWRRDALMVAFFLGAISNGILSKVLKKVINQSRPEGANDMPLKPSDGGMPSSHAMSLGFIGTFTSFEVPFEYRVGLVVYAVVSLYYRVAVQLHTWPQIGVGLAIGVTNGALWWYLCRQGVMEWVSVNLLNEDGQLPIVLLAVPAIVGVLVVGSVERRLKRWIEKLKQD